MKNVLCPLLKFNALLQLALEDLIVGVRRKVKDLVGHLALRKSTAQNIGSGEEGRT